HLEPEQVHRVLGVAHVLAGVADLHRPRGGRSLRGAGRRGGLRLRLAAARLVSGVGRKDALVALWGGRGAGGGAELAAFRVPGWHVRGLVATAGAGVLRLGGARLDAEQGQFAGACGDVHQNPAGTGGNWAGPFGAWSNPGGPFGIGGCSCTLVKPECFNSVMSCAFTAATADSGVKP